MALFPSLPATPMLSDVLSRFPSGADHLLRWVDDVMRADGPLPSADREMIAAYVSGLNACAFCHGAHVGFARIFGIPDGTIEALLEDLETAPVRDALKPLLAYVRELNALPARLTDAHAQAAYDAGWTEEDLFDAIRVCAAFNAMNRIVEGAGVVPPAEPPAADPLAPGEPQPTYIKFGHRLGLIDPEKEPDPR
ncbi:MAG: carboxymuconolactone decarboxylase family protein [Pseudomonadota bacterium]